MYQFSYAEIMDDGVADAKDRERQVLSRSIELLQAASEKGQNSQASVEAVYYTRRVWTSLVQDLASSENQLDKEVRANLISIGIWILKETEKIRLRESSNYQAIIDITTIIRDGLK
jgi:flagellar biosynthesis activator protein FlaF